MYIPLLAAFFAASTAFVGVGAMTGQFGMTRRRFVARAERLAARDVPERRPVDGRADLLRSDSLAGNRAVANVLRRWNWALRRAELLERGQIPLKVSEWVTINLSIFSALTFVVTLLSRGLLPAGVAFGIGGVLFFEAWIRGRAQKRRIAFERQLPTALEVMSTSLKSGFGIMESMNSVAHDQDPPVAEEFARIIDETRVGGSFEEAMERTAERVQSADFRIVVRALLIHRAVGGDLAEVLDSVGSTMRERDALRGHITSLTAQQRFGAVIVGLLPAWVIGFFVVTAPEFISPLWTEPAGRLMFAIGAGLDVLAFFAMRRVLRIEV